MSVAADGRRGVRAAWIVTALWLASFAGSLGLPGPAGKALGGVQFLASIAVVLVHGGVAYGRRGAAAFFAIVLAIGFALESFSIHHGVPFGFYEHGDTLGPKLLAVPIPVALGYVTLGYLAWSVARILVRERPGMSGGLYRWTTPLVATFVLAGYDLAFDPIGATALGLWRYRTPIGHTGVPLSNYAGWLVTGWLFFQLFALVEARFASRRRDPGAGFWVLPCLIWGAAAFQYPVLLARAPAGTVERAGRVFVVADIYAGAVPIAFLTVFLAAMAAAFRLLSIREADRYTAPAARNAAASPAS